MTLFKLLSKASKINSLMLRPKNEIIFWKPIEKNEESKNISYSNVDSYLGRFYYEKKN